MRKKGFIMRCKECGNVFRAKRRNRKYCSDRCKKRAQRSKIIGTENGGLRGNYVSTKNVPINKHGKGSKIGRLDLQNMSIKSCNTDLTKKQLKRLEKEYWITDLKFDDDKVSLLFVDPLLKTHVYEQTLDKVNIDALLRAIHGVKKEEREKF